MEADFRHEIQLRGLRVNGFQVSDEGVWSMFRKCDLEAEI
jgi:hypothetical protein